MSLISLILDWKSEGMTDYFKKHNLLNELNYFDPTKGSQVSESGLYKVKFKSK